MVRTICASSVAVSANPFVPVREGVADTEAVEVTVASSLTSTVPASTCTVAWRVVVAVGVAGVRVGEEGTFVEVAVTVKVARRVGLFVGAVVEDDEGVRVGRVVAESVA